ncbi:MAG: hypothetical protein M2R45_02818 [Verrucomicrobia subdivision 3 bacterium]|nr:hypothetical protein [Limisphaerales bacterium]MCS1415479.1 hypothetical protein [Limisphaerales bacterium]
MNHRVHLIPKHFRWFGAWSCGALFSYVAGLSQASEVFDWRRQADEWVVLFEDAKEVFTFQLGPRSLDGKFARSNYMHPLRNPAGDVVTEDFPEDHYHHRGVFWTWHQLRQNGRSLADPWLCQGTQWLAPDEPGSWLTTEITSDSATLKVVRDWVVPDPVQPSDSIRPVRESAIITAWRSEDRYRVLDIDLRFTALVDGISIGGSEDDKGYGGFSPRIQLADDVRFEGQVGPVIPARTAVDGGAWMDVSGTYEGRRRGFTMMVHPTHPAFPLKWILRAKRSMQNPQWPGRDPAALSTERPTRLRYRLVLHDGTLEHSELEGLWQQFGLLE